jgi:hypothetical protein
MTMWLVGAAAGGSGCPLGCWEIGKSWSEPRPNRAAGGGRRAGPDRAGRPGKTQVMLVSKMTRPISGRTAGRVKPAVSRLARSAGQTAGLTRSDRTGGLDRLVVSTQCLPGQPSPWPIQKCPVQARRLGSVCKYQGQLSTASYLYRHRVKHTQVGLTRVEPGYCSPASGLRWSTGYASGQHNRCGPNRSNSG